MFLHCFVFLDLVIRGVRILLFGKTTHHKSGSQWCQFVDAQMARCALLLLMQDRAEWGLGRSLRSHVLRVVSYL